MTILRYIISKLLVGMYKQVTNSPKFLLALRNCIFNSDFDQLKTDAKHLILDTDQKIFETLSRTITRNNLSSITRTLEFRIKTGFGMVFPDFRDELSRFFRLKFSLDTNYLAGADFLSDLRWEDVVDDEDLKTMVYRILSDLEGHDLPPHPVENIVKVSLSTTIFKSFDFEKHDFRLHVQLLMP